MNGAKTESRTAEDIAKAAKDAFDASQLISSQDRVAVLDQLRNVLRENKAEIFEANQEDLKAAKLDVEAGKLSISLLKRLDLTSGDKFDSMLQGISDVASLPDPNEKVTYAKELHDGLSLYRITCPIGALLVIFESRPEVVVNITALAIKSGNSAILKGGKESSRTTAALAKYIRQALSQSPLHPDYIQTVQTRAEISSLLDQDRYIDLVIPRGSNSLVRSIQQASKIPVMGHADGLCNVYVDKDASPDKVQRIVLDSKTDYPAACNAAENLLIHQDVLETIWPKLATALLEADVHLRCDEATLAVVTQGDSATNGRIFTHVQHADPAVDYDTEYLSNTIAVATVPSLGEAIQFINKHSSHHTDVIITETEASASTFVRGVDSSGVFWNASSRFADGFRYGFGTEVGISTGKTHARGPVGLEGLVIYKYVLRSEAGDGHIVGEFGQNGTKKFTHRPISNVTSLPF